MRVRRRRRSHRIEFIGNGASKVRMILVDLGVDDRNQYVVASVDAMGLQQMQFANDILRRCITRGRILPGRLLRLRADINKLT